MNSPDIESSAKAREVLENKDLNGHSPEKLKLSDEEQLVVDLMIGNHKMASILKLAHRRLNIRWERAEKYPEFSYITDDKEMKEAIESIPEETSSFLNQIMRVAYRFDIDSKRMGQLMAIANQQATNQSQSQ